MAKSGADLAHEQQAIEGTYDVAPSQGSFIGRLAVGLGALLLFCALMGFVAAIKG